MTTTKYKPTGWLLYSGMDDTSPRHYETKREALEMAMAETCDFRKTAGAVRDLSGMTGIYTYEGPADPNACSITTYWIVKASAWASLEWSH